MYFPHGVTVIRLIASLSTDPYSHQLVPDWTKPYSQEPIKGCVVYQTQTDETSSVGRETTAETLTVLIPPNTSIKPQDRLLIDTKTYIVEGWPRFYHSPFTGWNPGGQITVKRIEG